MPTVKINQQTKTVEVSAIRTDHRLVYEYFNGLPSDARDAAVLRALSIGVLAMSEDRIATFLSKTKNELGTELETLKIIYDIQEREFFESSIKGNVAEEDIAAFLTELCEAKGYKDDITLTGNAAGAIPKNKTGDICCTVDSPREARIVIECKFDKGIAMGDIINRDIFGNRIDTAWSQLIEARANREGRASIIVFDREIASPALVKQVDNVSFIPGVGFVVIVDSRRGDYQNLAIAYSLARDICIRPTSEELDRELLSIVVQRVLKDIRDVAKVEVLVRQASSALRGILEQTHKGRLSMEFSQQLLERLLLEGTLTPHDVLALYTGSEPKTKYEAIRQQLSEMAPIPE